MSTPRSRSQSHRTLSRTLGALSDRQLGSLLGGATPLRTGIGGAAARLDVDGVPVFVKRVPLTDLELGSRSTANLFGLPTFYQYGVGSAGFGAWRELAAHEAANEWVLTGDCPSFPLMYHWRVLPGSMPVWDEDIDGMVAYWEGSPAVRTRLEAVAAAPATLVLFLEYVPHTLHAWLTDRVAEGGAGTESAIDFADSALATAVSFLGSRGFVHFDAHPLNVLTDGSRLYVTDFGLALHDGFELTEAESDFLRLHRDYDRYDVARYTVNWLITALCPEADLVAVVRECAAGRLPGGLPAAATRIIERDAPAAAAMNEFYHRLVHETKTAVWPGITG